MPVPGVTFHVRPAETRVPPLARPWFVICRSRTQACRPFERVPRTVTVCAPPTDDETTTAPALATNGASTPPISIRPTLSVYVAGPSAGTFAEGCVADGAALGEPAGADGTAVDEHAESAKIAAPTRVFRAVLLITFPLIPRRKHHVL